jgi:cystathionine gamma-synthase
VNYPRLASHTGHVVAAQQMREFGRMMSIELRGGRGAALSRASKVKIFTNATSLGGCESLIEHRASVEGPNPRSPQGLLRISVGLEHVEDLIEDLRSGLVS